MHGQPHIKLSLMLVQILQPFFRTEATLLREVSEARRTVKFLFELSPSRENFAGNETLSVFLLKM